MLTAQQIAAIISANVDPDCERQDGVSEAAEKILAAMPDYNAIMVAGAALENEVTSTLMDMLAATILATLIEEEGGGRSNISYSPVSMDYMTKHYDYTVENEGLTRTVRIKMKDDSPLAHDREAWSQPSNRHGVMRQDYGPETFTSALPQAEPKVYDRPFWVIKYHKDDVMHFAKMNDQADAVRRLGHYKLSGEIFPSIENRHCLHTECPASGCTKKSEATSG